MRPTFPGLADQNDRFHRKALVLGEPFVARQVAKSLAIEGFDPMFLEELTQEPFPQVTDSNSIPRVRSILSSFANLTQESGIVHPTTTPWAERPELANIGQALGLTIVAPSLKILSLFNNKLSFLLEAEKLRIPNLALSFDPVHSLREIEELHGKVGKIFPFVLKAAKGGRSSNIFVCSDLKAMEKSLPLWLDQVRWNSGEVVLFLERYLEGARHITVPFVRFQDGRARTFPLSDTSLQSCFRKMIEYCPAGRLDSEVEERLVEWTLRLIQDWNYVGVGNLSFLVDGDRAFLVNGQARMDTGFCLWEKIAGTNAVAWQMEALRGTIGQEAPKILPKSEWKSGVLLRVFADDPKYHFPQPGKIQEVSEKCEWIFSGAKAQLGLNYSEGQEVSIRSSGLIGLISVVSKTRSQLSSLSIKVLNDLWIAGSIQTNELFLKEVLSHPWVQEEMFHAGFLDEEFIPGARTPDPITGVFRELRQWVRKNGLSRLREVTEDSADFWVEGPRLWEAEFGLGASGWVRAASGEVFPVMVYPLRNRNLIKVGSWCIGMRSQSDSPSPVGEGRLVALSAGRVHAVLFREGSVVPAHEPLVILEAFGVFVPHALPSQTKIHSWKIKAEDWVGFGQDLAEIGSVQDS